MVIKRCVIGANEGGLDALCKNGHKFDLAVVDIMLSWDEAALKRCDDLQKKWNDLQKSATEFRQKKDSQKRLSELRKELQWLSGARRREIDDEAGVKLVKQWLAWLNGQSPANATHRPSILFLTARHFESFARDELQQITEHARWITKPVLEMQVLGEAAELLAEADEQKGALPHG